MVGSILAIRGGLLILSRVSCTAGRSCPAARATRVSELDAEVGTDDRGWRVGVGEAEARLKVLVVGANRGGAVADIRRIGGGGAGVGKAGKLEYARDANDGVYDVDIQEGDAVFDLVVGLEVIVAESKIQGQLRSEEHTSELQSLRH